MTSALNSQSLRAQLLRDIGSEHSVLPPSIDTSGDGKTFVYVRSNPSSRVMVIQNLPAMVAKRRAGGRGTP